MVRARFAPSPTGYLHIGAARTALFNWLFVRHHKGKFILRIEDTDFIRSSDEMSRRILEGLKWLGMDWDEGPFFQSERLEVYRIKADELVENGHAYQCFCLPEEIRKRKQGASSRGEYWEYDRRCLNLPEDEKKQFEKEGRPRAVRFLVPEREIKYRDLVHGPISVESQNIEDFVLLRGDGLPTYHLSVVVDDIEQGITHVIRGDDHISNTPKQLLLYKAFDSPLPEFAHLALILGTDKKKLSKRHGVTSLHQFEEDGYFPQAMLNFLAQMSWSPGDKERLYSIAEMIQEFSLEKLSKGSPIFDRTKLEWLNGQWISQMKAEELSSYVTEELKRVSLWQADLANNRKSWYFKLIDLLKERSRTIKDFAVRAQPFLSDDYSYDLSGIEKHLRDEKLGMILPLLKEDFLKMGDFSAGDIEPILRQRAEKEGIKAALLIHALRMLVVGTPVSPGIFEVLELIGKNKTIERMSRLRNVVG
jgi:glutamyl-tRNA synthetase/nondiscriminating glutamyl-tRNA synthetase